jgi:tRNA threonylcarbamoyladenosine biosynthesis protein TsaB
VTVVLAIDTASPAFALAIDDGSAGTPRLVESATDFSHASLLAAVEEELRGVPLEAVVAVCGPGSYSGLRAGIATAQGLALAQGCTLAGISTLEAVAAACEDAGDLTAIHPAGRGDFAAQTFRAGSPEGPQRIAPPEDLAGAVLAGEGAAALGGREVLPRERAAAALVRFRAGALAPVSELTAIYLREPNITAPRRPFGPAGAQDRLPAR